jgi:16S rRNA (uracil1498-N3)-methyltransferase
MRVMRLQPGDAVFLFDGAGAEFEGELMSIDGATAQVRILGPVASDAESPLRVVLVQAVPVKLPRMDTIVRQTTELGVARIVPVLTARGQIPAGGERTLARRVERWRRVAETAAQQCGRSVVPAVADTVAWRDLELSSLPRPLALFHGAGESAGAGWSDVGTGLASAGDAMTLMVGPEGGWSEEELATARAADAEVVNLGPRVLRADTAGAVAMSIAQWRWGDVSGRPRS